MSQKKVADDEIDLKALLAVLITYWKLILSMFLIGLAIGIFYAKTATPIYQSNALIQVDKKSQGVSALGNEVSDLLQAENSPAATEVQILTSRMILMPVINMLHLDTHLSEVEKDWTKKLPYVVNNRAINTEVGVSIPEDKVWVNNFNTPKEYYGKTFILSASNAQDFQLDSQDGLILKGKIGKPARFTTSFGNIDILVTALPANRSYYLVKQAPSQAIETLKASLAVNEQGQQTGILNATMQGVNQDQITNTLSKIVLTYAKHNQEKSTAETTKTLRFMEEQLPKLKNKLAQAELEFNKFREQNSTVDIDKEAEIAVNERTAIETSLRELQLKKAELSQRYTDDYPVLQQLNAQIADLEGRKVGLNSQITKIPEVQRKFLELSSDVKISSEIYLTMLKNYEQLQIVKSGQIGNVRVLDMPISTYQPIAPKKSQIVVLAGLLGLIAGIALALLRSLFNTAVKDPDVLEDQTGVPVIAVIPRSNRIRKLLSKKSSQLPLVEQIEPEGIASEGIKSLRTHLFFNSKKPTGNKLLITGASPGIGKSFVSANLAVSMAMSGKRVLLVDADARLGHLHDYFNMVNGYGLIDFLSERSVDPSNSIPNELIQRTIIDNLDFIPRGKAQKNSSELFLNNKMSQLLAQVEGYYDYIIVDSSPVMGTSDSLALGQLSDQVLFIARYGVSAAKQVDFAISKLRAANIEVEGIVFNDTQQSVIDSYNYHYSYDYKAKK